MKGMPACVVAKVMAANMVAAKMMTSEMWIAGAVSEVHAISGLRRSGESQG
jgi:hypothetical protein